MHKRDASRWGVWRPRGRWRRGERRAQAMAAVARRQRLDAERGAWSA